jgi:Predicted AAA-ATPase/PD-(D/E)XK nuclease superfamily
MKNLPLGIQHFNQLIERPCLYVDKTKLIVQLLNQFQTVFLSRPRRFGKSLLLSTIAQLYMGKKELFAGLWAENHWDWSKTHPVVHVYMDRTGFTKIGLEAGLIAHLDILAADHGLSLEGASSGFRFENLILQLRRKYDRRVVVLIDEYDKPILDVLHEPETAEQNRQTLSDFYGVLKPLGDSIQFLMLTGISKFSQVSIFSKLNQLKDITLNADYGALLGYTQTETELYFEEYLRAAEQKMAISREELLAQIKKWYNGYSWDLAHQVYNPVSFMKFCSRREFANYWFATGTPEFLVKQLKQRQFYAVEDVEMSELAFEGYTPDDMDPIMLLFQTGYLTLREKKPHNIFRLDYPNHEVRAAFMQHLLGAYGSGSKNTAGPTVWRLRDAFFRNDLEAAISVINVLFENIPGTLARKKTEADYHAMLYLVFRYMGIEADAEVSGLRGRSDAVLRTPSHIYVIEFKLDQSAQAAIEYIRQKGYAEKYRHDGRPVLLLGIGFSRKERAVADWKAEPL